MRKWQTGSPWSTAQAFDSPLSSVMSRVSVSGANDCWPFRGATDKHGYGQIRFRGKAYRATRVVMNAPAGLDVCHRCDNPPCCNPAHLFIGTRADNMRDCAAKGRVKTNRRISLVDAALVKSFIADGHSQAWVAVKLGVPWWVVEYAKEN